jgi:hypothetical protein
MCKKTTVSRTVSFRRIIQKFTTPWLAAMIISPVNTAFRKNRMLLLLTFLQNLRMPAKQILVGETKYYITVQFEDLGVDDRVILQ